MVRIKDRDDLSDVKGRMNADFRAVTLDAAFLDAAAERPQAERALAAFYVAAQMLRRREHEFNARDRQPAASLMTNLRNADHFSAMRAFNAAKAELAHTPTGQRIVKMVEKNIHTRPKF